MSSSDVQNDRRPRKGDAAGEEMLTEISVAPDGRVFVFGASIGVLEALSAIGLGGEALVQRVNQLRKNSGTTTNASSTDAHSHHAKPALTTESEGIST